MNLTTLGYAHPNAKAELDRLMSDERALLIDIRLSPRSRWYPAWNRKALERDYREHYRWEPRLGNINYQQRELGIQLAKGHEDAIREIAAWLLQDVHIILLCACKDARTCHRSQVERHIHEVIHAGREEAHT